MKKKMSKTKRSVKKVAKKVVGMKAVKVKVEKDMTQMVTTTKITRIEFVKELVRKYFRGQGFWHKAVSEQAPILQAFWKEVQSCVEPPMKTVLCFPSDDNYYNVDTNTVHMTKASVMTLLHFLRLALHTATINTIRVDDMHWSEGNRHNDYVYWSHIVFREAMPNLYADSFNRKLFFFLPDKDALDKAKKIYNESEFVMSVKGNFTKPTAKEGQIVLSAERSR